MPSSVTVINAQYTYDSSTGIIVLNNPTGNVSVNVVCEQEQPQEEYFLTFKSNNGTQFDTSVVVYDLETWEEVPGISWDGTVEYSTDKTNWTVWDGTSVSSSLNGEIYFRGTENTYIDDGSGAGRFVFNVTNDMIAIKGNIENLLDYEEVSLGNHPVMAAGCFAYLFANMSGDNNNIEHANELILNATILTDSCYTAMFSGCTSLITAPALPATTLAPDCYNSMFYGCTSLTQTPELPATILMDGCYSFMFADCTSLEEVPELLSGGLVGDCYLGMFSGCTSLYVSDTQITEAQYEWRIPADDVISGIDNCEQSDMFTGCLGTRESDYLAGEVGQQYIYYTQNPPVGSN